MKKLILLLLLVCTGTTLSWAQGSKRVTVSGTVVDGDDKSPIAQATVQLLSLPDSTMAVGNVTNNNGVFSVAARPGKYCFEDFLCRLSDSGEAVAIDCRQAFC